MRRRGEAGERRGDFRPTTAPGPVLPWEAGRSPAGPQGGL